MHILRFVKNIGASRLEEFFYTRFRFNHFRTYCTVKDTPVKYSVSKASQWKAEYTRRGTPSEEMPWFQPYVVTLSVMVFLIYFSVLREENDIDESLGTSLYQRIEGLEESQLRAVLKFDTERGKDTTKIKARLRELELERSAN